MAIHWKVLIGVVLGLLVSYIASFFELGETFILNYIKPFGVIFIKALKLVAVPLVFVSLAKGIT